MQNFIFDLMNHFGYIGILLLIFIENIFPPLPSELILLFGGFMTTYTNLKLVIMALFATLGSLIGALILYYLGKVLTKERLKKIISLKGKILRIKDSDIDKSNKWFENKGSKAIFICKFIPLIRSLISIPAGMNKMNLNKFIIYTCLGSFIWNFVLLFIGSKVGSSYGSIAKIISQYSLIILIILLILSLTYLIHFYFKRKKNK